MSNKPTYFKSLTILAVTFFLLINNAKAQVSISGPSCVTAGVEYQYTISGNWDSNTYMEWCVTGGTITGSGTCKSGTPSPQVYVTFTAGTGRRIDLYTSNGSTSLNVTVSATFDPGTITPTSRDIYWGQTSPDIICTQAAGGGCAPTFYYQWQQSSNNITFTDINGATGANLTFSSGPFVTTYYRRKTTISISGTVGYSNTHTLNVSAPLYGGFISTSNQIVEYPAIPSTLTTSAGSGGGCSTFTYLWEESNDNITFTAISPSVTTLDYTFGSAPQRSRYYRRKISCTGPQIGFSNSVYVIVVFKPGTLSASQSIASGGAVSALSITGTVGGFGSSYGYQWEKSTDEITWTAVATTSSYSPPSPTVTTYYRVKVSALSESLYTNTICIRVSTTTSSSSLIPVAMPSYPSGTDANNMNYIRSRTFTKPGIADITTANAQTNKLDVVQSTTYFDGLGREWQTVVKSATPAGKDMVSTVWYDNYGRVLQNYLPYTDNLETGNFRTDPNTQQPAFYNTYFSNTESFYYSANVYENSPLNRALMQTAPGKSWTGNNRGVRTMPRANRLTEDVRMFTIGSAIGSVPQYISQYNAGELMVTETTDEQDNKVIEYKERNGLVVLKKVQSSNILQEGYTGWLCTYYVYDDFRRLRYVMPPKAVEWMMANSWNLSANVTVQNELCFRYEYDGEGRMIIKKVPGSGDVYMVYDARDRLVMTQDANTRQTEQWLVTVYENDLNRPTHSYLITDPTKFNDPDYHRTAAAGSTAYPVLANYTTKTLISETHYDDYTSLPSGLSGTLNASGYASYLTASSSSPEYAEPVTQSAAIMGMVTWTWSKVLGTTGDRIETAYIYDDKGRVIQVQTYNMTRGKDVLTTQYDFAGKVLGTHLKHTMKGTANQTFELATKNSYDDLGRLTRVEKKTVPQVGTNWKTIATLEYDDLGQLKSKKLAPGFGSSGLETLSYAYNIRGWLLGINRDYIQSNTGSKFGFELAYDKQTSVINGGATNTYDRTFYNGNIAGTIWRSAGDGEKRKYDFDYDAANRLLKADFNQYSGGWSNATMNFSVGGNTASGGTMKYDANGNIVEMWQQGWKLSGSDYIDKLSYTYFNGGNKLQAVTDGMTTDHKQGDFTDKNTTATDYGYDLNGNLITDLNRKIGSTTGIDQTTGTAIKYNHLNLVDRVNPKWDDGTSKGNIDYDYDALSGGRVRKVVAENPVAANGNRTITTTTHYVNGFVYESKTYSPANPSEANYDRRLLYIAHEEGRMRPVRDANGDITDFVYDYFVKDHLGNVRMVLTEEQKQDAYPAASMEDVADKTNLNDPKNYIPYYSSTDYTTNSSWRYPISSVSGYPTDNFTTPNNYVTKLRGDGQKIGPGIVLKVMAGDKFNIRVSSWYKTNGASPNSPQSPLTDLIAVLNNSIGGITSTHGGVSVTELQNSGVLSPGATSFLSTQTPDANRPKAYLNWVLFDEQFKFVQTSSNAEQVPAESAFGTAPNQLVYPHVKSDLPIDKNGYLYVYVSNETPNIDVFFDNLQVTHVRGPLLEETHYYPFGLTMSGISSKALAFGNPKNKKGYNGNELQSGEFSDGSGLEFYDFNARSYDQQIGRFMQIDPLSDTVDQSSLGPFQFSYNNPVRYNDPSGKCPCLFLIPVFKAVVAAVVAAVVVKTAEPLIDEVVKSVEDRTFDGKHDTESKTQRESFRKAKEENGIARSQQPDKTIKPNTPEGDEAGLDNRNGNQYEFTNSRGKKVTIRQDKPANYNEGGNGDQGPHFNAGKSGEKLKQHHYYNNQSKQATSQKPWWQTW